MRTVVGVCLLATALAATSAARAQPAAADGPTAVDAVTVRASLGVQGLVGNTIVDKAPDGTWWIQLHPDGAYDTYLNGGRVAHGAWTYDGGKLCYNPHEAAAFCAREAMAGKRVGDSWTTTGPDGRRYEAVVVKGPLGG
jgi:hypothetical protein